MKTHKTISIERMRVRGSEELLRVTKALDIEEDLSLIFHSWKNLERACIRLAFMLTRELPGRSRPLIEEIIAAAYGEYCKSIKLGEAPTVAMVRFLHSLANSAYEILRFQIGYVDTSGSFVPWQDFRISIHDWAVEHKQEELFVRAVEEPSTDVLIGGRIQLCAAIMMAPDLAKLNLIPQSQPLSHKEAI